jgi:hypothetical protein
MSFTKLKLMSALRIIPRRLASMHPPKCAGYIFGAMTKKPWRTKAEPIKVKTVVVTGPGDCVLVYQLESSTPGFVAQLKAIVTKRRYTCATVFDDHFSQGMCICSNSLRQMRLWIPITRCYNQTLSCI